MSNLYGLSQFTDGTLKTMPNYFSASTNDTEATVTATGYFTDRSDVLKANDSIVITTDVAGTPKLVRGFIVDSGTPTAPILTLDLFKVDQSVSYAVYDALYLTQGGSTTETFMVDGLQTTDRVYATMHEVGASPAVLITARVSATNTVELVFNVDPTADHQLSIMITRNA